MAVFLGSPCARRLGGSHPTTIVIDDHFARHAPAGGKYRERTSDSLSRPSTLSNLSPYLLLDDSGFILFVVSFVLHLVPHACLAFRDFLRISHDHLGICNSRQPSGRVRPPTLDQSSAPLGGHQTEALESGVSAPNVEIYTMK